MQQAGLVGRPSAHCGVISCWPWASWAPGGVAELDENPPPLVNSANGSPYLALSTWSSC